MRIFHLTSVYPEYIDYFFKTYQVEKSISYKNLKEKLDQDFFAWSDSWSNALSSKKIDCIEVLYNVDELQNAWWRENRSHISLPEDKYEILSEQIKEFSPDIIWFNDSSAKLLDYLYEKIGKKIKIVGWVGSALPELRMLKKMDLVLSCAQESVDFLRKEGLRAEQMHHGFDERILKKLPDAVEKNFSISFFGQLIVGSGFHKERTRFLESIVTDLDIHIFSSIYSWGIKKEIKAAIKRSFYYCKNPKRFFFKIDSLPASVLSQKNLKLKKFICPPVYGLKMYEAILSSKVVLNFHADSSPLYASNMRLFETTGVGTCLLTDWKENLPELFDIDREIVTYKSVDECVEKAMWLLENPQKAEEIALAGQRRTLSDHTFKNRADYFLKSIRAL
ncbi:MAG: glycosyltransferase [Oligoflexia bacterium]|nr:glycosyltransferase [Oligoflexia bacterium]